MSDQLLAQLPWFRSYIESGRAPAWTMGPADLHGFLTALAMTGPMPEGHWTSWVWSGDVPAFASDAEEQNVLDELLAFEEQVRKGLCGYRPLSVTILPHVGDGWYFAADWAEGFLQAIEANPQPWQVALDEAETSLTVVLGTCYNNHDDENLGYVGLEALDEINYHIRVLLSVMRKAAGRSVARAA
jgi:yecA family protein